MFFPAQFDQTELGRRSYCATKRTAHSMVRTSSKGTQTKGTDMTGNTTARTQAIELAERLREVAAWNVRLHLAKEGLEQQAYRNFCGAYNRGPALWEQACRPVIFVAWKMMRPRWWAVNCAPFVGRC